MVIRRVLLDDHDVFQNLCLRFGSTEKKKTCNKRTNDATDSLIKAEGRDGTVGELGMSGWERSRDVGLGNAQTCFFRSFRVIAVYVVVLHQVTVTTHVPVLSMRSLDFD